MVPIGCRSDAGLSAPIIKRLKEADWCECIIEQLRPANFFQSYNAMAILMEHEPFDMVLCVGDRIEMNAAASAAYCNGIKIGHVYAGALGDFEQKATLDDVNRFVISLYADIAFCEDKKASYRVFKLWKVAHKINELTMEMERDFERFHIYKCGITHFDDLITDESKVPPNPYDLVLLNRTINKEIINDINCAHLRNPIFIKSNPDRGFLPINISNCYKIYDNLPRGQFLGLLKHCSRFITNSSAAYYEAPFFLKKEQFIQVGARNSAREFKRRAMGASDKIVKILKDYFKNKTNEV